MQPLGVFFRGAVAARPGSRAGEGEIGGELAQVMAKAMRHVAVNEGGKGEAAGAHKADIDFEDAGGGSVSGR